MYKGLRKKYKLAEFTKMLLLSDSTSSACGLCYYNIDCYKFDIHSVGYFEMASDYFFEKCNCCKHHFEKSVINNYKPLYN